MLVRGPWPYVCSRFEGHPKQTRIMLEHLKKTLSSDCRVLEGQRFLACLRYKDRMSMESGVDFFSQNASNPSSV